jgi:serine/threonine-protein kinase RsbW
VNGDVIKFSFPAKPNYILAVRLAVSAIAERIGFNIDDIEDLKVASAEACTMLLSESPDIIAICITVDDGLQMNFDAEGQAPGRKPSIDEARDLSQYLLEALVDKCEFLRQDDAVRGVRFYKKRQ